MIAMDNQAPVGLAIQQLWKLKVAGRITEEQFIDMTVDVWRFLERLRLRPAQRRAALNVVPHVVSTGPKCWNMLDVVCSLKCCFNMWNILGGPYPQGLWCLDRCAGVTDRGTGAVGTARNTRHRPEA